MVEWVPRDQVVKQQYPIKAEKCQMTSGQLTMQAIQRRYHIRWLIAGMHVSQIYCLTRHTLCGGAPTGIAHFGTRA
ncbi:hypothetical protein TNCV_808161 [Trichonephila clavipes]|nr:hypothetical protein TNCV_808161 [Trichonephila clavipes]